MKTLSEIYAKSDDRALIASFRGDSADFIIHCRSAVGQQLSVSEPWVMGKPVSFVYLPAGLHTISAGFRSDETITCSVEVDEQTAKDLQESFDHICATQQQEPYADEDHESKKATLRFPPGKVKFVFGNIKEHEGVIVQGGEPTSYGAEVVNGKVYRSWSPEFATDADYAKAKCKKKHWTFPDGVRGSESNPARIVAVNFVTGALTNKPAFQAMPPVKASRKSSPSLQDLARQDIGLRTASVIADRMTVSKIANRVTSTRLANQIQK